MITDIVRPKTVAEAVRAKSAPGAAWLGGGTWLNSGKAEHVTTLVSLENLGLDSIRTEEGRCLIGAAVTFQELADSALVPHALRAAARLTASRTLRNMVTVGGELGLGAGDSAVIPVFMALGADVNLAGKKKPVQIRKFLDEGSTGLILGVSVPVSDCRGPLVRLEEAENSLDGAALPPRERIESLARAGFSPQPDIHASVEYKRYMAGVLVADLLAALAAEAGT